jgi:TonB family protein
MRFCGLLLFALLCSGISTLLSAQEILAVDAKAIQQHIDHKAFPVYPPTAKAARVQGTVVFDLQIGTTGKIESMEVVSGPSMLQQAAIDCLKQWTFHPSQKDGRSVAALGQYSIIFVLSDSTNTTIGHGPSVPQQGQIQTVKVKSENAASGPDKALNDKFDEVGSDCKNGILSKQFNDDTVSKCRQAAILADELPMDGNYISKRSAYVYAASAYADIGDFKGALPWAVKAVDVVKLGHDGNSGSSAAYEDKGIIEGNLEDLMAADQDLSVAEDFERKGMVDMEKDPTNIPNNYIRFLVRALRFHAQVLQKLNRPDDAQKKLDEAAKYN